jgi:transposase-like protein
VTVLRQVDQCTGPGEIGALLRREGLYSSHLTDWRRQREAGELAALAPKKRGRKPSVVEQQAAEVVRMQREIDRLRERLRQAEAIIGAQKKLAELLGQPLDEVQNSGRS